MTPFIQQHWLAFYTLAIVAVACVVGYRVGRCVESSRWLERFKATKRHQIRMRPITKKVAAAIEVAQHLAASHPTPDWHDPDAVHHQTAANVRKAVGDGR
jgi:hypothetical protein